MGFSNRGADNRGSGCQILFEQPDGSVTPGLTPGPPSRRQRRKQELLRQALTAKAAPAAHHPTSAPSFAASPGKSKHCASHHRGSSGANNSNENVNSNVKPSKPNASANCFSQRELKEQVDDFYYDRWNTRHVWNSRGEYGEEFARDDWPTTEADLQELWSCEELPPLDVSRDTTEVPRAPRGEDLTTWGRVREVEEDRLREEMALKNAPAHEKERLHEEMALDAHGFEVLDLPAAVAAQGGEDEDGFFLLDLDE